MSMFYLNTTITPHCLHEITELVYVPITMACINYYSLVKGLRASDKQDLQEKQHKRINKIISKIALKHLIYLIQTILSCKWYFRDLVAKQK